MSTTPEALSLANEALYRDVPADRVLSGVSMASMLTVLRQLGQLAQLSAQVDFALGPGVEPQMMHRHAHRRARPG
jgi:hypothetical protein